MQLPQNQPTNNTNPNIINIKSYLENMCLQRKQIYTNAHKIHRYGCQPYTLSIPCQECTECRQDKWNEWEARTYYQYLDCTEKGGFVLWDTLTYADEHRPYLSKLEMGVPKELDFYCFDLRDTQLFLKRLRTNLEAEHYEVTNNIKYLYATEYGQNEDKTMRPHIHLLLFCNTPISPIELSMHVKRAWKLGRTCGVEDMPDYFRAKGVVKGKASALKVAHYMGKYCLKQQEYDKVAAYKVKKLCEYWYKQEHGLDEYENDTEKIKEGIKAMWKTNKWHKEKQRILRRVQTFHKQSQGYGKYAIEAGAIKDGSLLGMPNSSKIYWYQKLPMYFVRKLYYNYERKGKQITWYLTDAGIEWKKRNINAVIEHTAKKLREKMEFTQSSEFRNIILEYFKNERKIDDDSYWYKLNDELFAYLNGRSWEHYANYIIFQKGRIWNGYNIVNPQTSTISNAKAALFCNNYAEEHELYYNYCHRIDIEHLKRQLVSPRNMGNAEEGYKPPIGDELKPQEFAHIYTINEQSLPEWKDYDKLTETIFQIDYYIEWMKARTEAHNEEQLRLHKGDNILIHN